MSSATGVVGLTGLLAWVTVSRLLGYQSSTSALVALVATAAPMVAWAVLVEQVHRNSTTGIVWDEAPLPFATTINVSMCKLLGYWAVWLAIAAFYLLMRWHWEGPFLFSMGVLAAVAPLVVIGSIPYVLWVDRRLKEPRDGAWHLGALLLGREDLADRRRAYAFLREWAIKGFFIAYMIAALPGSWSSVTGPGLADISVSSITLAGWLISFCLMIDLVFATVGYVLTLKPLDSHIRSADPYVAGWVAALLCYPPYGGLFDYTVGNSAGDSWAEWLRDYPFAAAIASCWLIAVAAFYAWSTVAFGFRFSNLTNRGIITNGPYRFTRHPAYVSKMLLWWSTVLPFATTVGGAAETLRNCSALAAVTGIYYWRARTEERHLSADPAYVAYSEWMERHGWLTRLLRRIPPPLSWSSTLRFGRGAHSCGAIISGPVDRVSQVEGASIAEADRMPCQSIPRHH